MEGEPWCVRLCRVFLRLGKNGCHPSQDSQDPVSLLPPAPLPEGAWQPQMPPDKPSWAGPGEGGKESELTSAAAGFSAASPSYAQTKAGPARLQPGIPRLQSAQSRGLESIGARCTQRLSASREGHPEQRGRLSSGGGGRFAVSGQSPLAPPRRCPLSSSVSGPPRYFLLPSSLLEEARLP